MMTREQAVRQAKELFDGGEIIEAGWVSMMLSRAPAGAPPDIVENLRAVFFLGAKYMLEAMVLTQVSSVSEETLTKFVDNLRVEIEKFEVAETLKRRDSDTAH